ncbi:MAG: transglycosylase SLT domain-containing protein [Acidimicrobiia bacterium]
MDLMGFPMRYPRLLIVLFVALGLAALSTTRAAAADEDALSDALRQVETLANISQQAATDAELARRGGAVELLAERVGLDHVDAGILLDAVAARVVSVAGAGERAGVLERPEIAVLFDMILEFVRSADPQSDQAFAKADFLAERVVAAAELLAESERTAMDALLSTTAIPVAGPVERWRPIVEQYFATERIDEALSIIDCESNGDPNARNPRSSASGLFQFLDRTWSHSSEQAGFEGASPFLPEANIAAAAWLVEYSLGVGDSPWAHWTCRP